MGFSQKNFIMNLGFFFLILVLQAGLLLLVTGGETVADCCKIKRLKKLTEKYRVRMHHNFILRTIIEGYMDFVILSQLHFQIMSFESAGNIFESFLAIFLFATSVIFPFFALFWLKINE